MRSEQAGDNLQADAFVEDLLKVIDTSIESPAGKVVQLKRIFQKAGVLVPDTIKPGESVNTKLSADVSVRDAVIYTWAWAPARWILGSLDTPVRLLHARHVPALKELISEFANSLRVGPHKTVLGALGWYVDGKRSHMLDAVALAVPEVGQTLDCCVYCDGGDLVSRRLLIETRVDVMLDLCDALQHLRTSGLVLLDLQPTNVALGDSTRDPYTGAVISLKHAYRVGAVLTEADVRELEAVYTAPPVAAGDVVEVGMDCWALGVLLWELVMGFKPVAGVQAPVRERGAHTDDAAASRNWIFATEAVTDTITHDTMTMLLLPSAVQRPSPAEVHHWLHSLKAQVASDMYQEMAAALADGTEMLEAADVDLGSSASLRREECAAACSAHVGEAGNDALVVEYQADRIGGTLSSLVVASPRACQEVTRAASLPQAQPRFPRWARRVGDKVKQAPVVAYAALIAVVLVAMKK